MQNRGLGRLVSLGFILVGSLGHAQEPLNVEEVQALLNRTQANSVETFLPQLSFEFRERRVFVYQSLMDPLVSPLHPSTILFSPDASLVISVPSDQGSDPQRLDMIQFNRDKKLFEFYQVQFGTSRPAQVVPGQGCVYCHGNVQSSRPLFQPPSHWPGVYGSDEGAVGGKLSDPEEARNFLKFSESTYLSPRYRYLAGSLPLHGRLFSSKISKLNHDRVGHLIRVTPSYEKYKFTFAGALLCKEMFWDFFPVESVERTLPPLHASRDDKSNLAIRYLGRKLGLPIEEWSMSHRPSQTEYDSFFGSYGSFEKEIAASAFLGDPELTTDLKEGACERMAAQSRMRLSQ